jgi:monoamine oxidase
MSPATDLPTLPVPNPTRSFWHTTHPNPLVHHRTTTDLPTRASVIIIGSGITGVFAARELIASGVTEVVVLEARDICSGATGRVSLMTKSINSLFT